MPRCTRSDKEGASPKKALQAVDKPPKPPRKATQKELDKLIIQRIEEENAKIKLDLAAMNQKMDLLIGSKAPPPSVTIHQDHDQVITSHKDKQDSIQLPPSTIKDKVVDMETQDGVQDSTNISISSLPSRSPAPTDTTRHIPAAAGSQSQLEDALAQDAARLQRANLSLRQSRTHPATDFLPPVLPSTSSLNQAARSVEAFAGDEDIVRAVRGLVQVQDLDSVANDPGEALSMFLIAGATLDSKIKAKIWANEFVELGSLVPKNQLPPGLNIHSEAGASSQFSITSAKVRQPSNVNEWHRWFAIYAAVYTQKYPTEAPGLFTYITRIFKLKDTHPNTYIWREYDAQFRRVRAFVSLPWHIQNLQILNDLDVNVSKSNVNVSNNNKNKSNSSTGGGSQKSEKICFEYNKPTGCTSASCKFAHRCSNCGIKNHPKTRCHRAKSESSKSKN